MGWLGWDFSVLEQSSQYLPVADFRNQRMGRKKCATKVAPTKHHKSPPRIIGLDLSCFKSSFSLTVSLILQIPLHVRS